VRFLATVGRVVFFGTGALIWIFILANLVAGMIEGFVIGFRRGWNRGRGE